MVWLSLALVFHFADAPKPCANWMEAASAELRDRGSELYSASHRTIILSGRLRLRERGDELSDRLERIQVLCVDYRVRCVFPSVDRPSTVSFEFSGEAQNLRELLDELKVHRVTWLEIKPGKRAHEASVIQQVEKFSPEAAERPNLGLKDATKDRELHLPPLFRDLALSHLHALMVKRPGENVAVSPALLGIQVLDLVRFSRGETKVDTASKLHLVNSKEQTLMADEARILSTLESLQKKSLFWKAINGLEYQVSLPEEEAASPLFTGAQMKEIKHSRLLEMHAELRQVAKGQLGVHPMARRRLPFGAGSRSKQEVLLGFATVSGQQVRYVETDDFKVLGWPLENHLTLVLALPKGERTHLKNQTALNEAVLPDLDLPGWGQSQVASNLLVALPSFSLETALNYRRIFWGEGWELFSDRPQLLGRDSIRMGALHNRIEFQFSLDGTKTAARPERIPEDLRFGDANTFIANRPFYFFLYDESTQLIWVAGYIANPSTQSLVSFP